MEDVQRIIPYEGKLASKREIISFAATDKPFLGTLNVRERKVLYAMGKMPIRAKKEDFAGVLAGKIIDRASVDIGIKDISEAQRRRFVEIAIENYGWLSALDFANAFEFAATSTLDDYFPKNANGTPKKEHYQNFSTDYVCRVMDAYIRYRGLLEDKLYKLKLPDARYALESKVKRIPFVLFAYLAYKYRNDDTFIRRYPVTLYEKLYKVGLVEPVEVTMVDKEEAVKRLINKSHTGIIKEFVAECIRHQQAKHQDVIAEAGLIAKEKALIKSFEVMAKEEIQITDYITLK